MENLEFIQSAFPTCQVDDLRGYGANIHTPKTIITIYYGRKKKYCLFGVWQRYDRLETLLEYLVDTVNPPKKVAPIEPQAFSDEELTDIVNSINRMHHEKAKDELEDYCKHKSQQGVQNCIDHISRKRDFILSNQPDNKLATFCLTLMDELRQYL